MRKTAVWFAILAAWIAIPADIVVASKYGGVWLLTGKKGYTTTMESVPHSRPMLNVGGTVVLSEIFSTMVDSIGTGDSIVTGGVGTYYSKDSTGQDTIALDLNGFVGQTVLVNAFFAYSASDTVFITVEQALSFRPSASDSSIAHSQTKWFNDGFWTTDTLFEDSLEASLDMMIVDGVSDSGGASRFYRDGFVIVAPLVRLNVKNKEGTTQDCPIFLEIYIRNKDAILGGASARQLDRWMR